MELKGKIIDFLGDSITEGYGASFATQSYPARIAARLMEDDQVSVGVYPEGTRSRTGELLPFHSGVLKIAQQAHVPVVVAAIQGVEGISRNFPLRRTNVRLDILETLPADYVAHCRSAALGNEIRDTLEAYLPRTQQPYPVAHTA